MENKYDLYYGVEIIIFISDHDMFVKVKPLIIGQKVFITIFLSLSLKDSNTNDKINV